MGYTTQVKTDQSASSQKLTLNQINQNYLRQLIEKINAVQPKKAVSFSSLFAKRQADCVDILQTRLARIPTEDKSDIEKYYSILLALHRCRLALAVEEIDPVMESKLKDVLISELSQFVESEFSLSDEEKNNSSSVGEKIVDEKIQKSLVKISDVTLYGSAEESFFCKAWQVNSPSSEYPFWQKMLIEMSGALNESPPNYNKIPATISAYFGVYHDSQLITEESGKQEIKIEKLNKEKLAKELEIFTYKNLVKYFTDYLIDYAINENNNDMFIRDKSIIIGKEVLCPLFEVVSQAKDLLAPNRAPDKNARDGWVDVYVANYKMIQANIKVLQSAHKISADIKGQITITSVAKDKLQLSAFKGTSEIKEEPNLIPSAEQKYASIADAVLASENSPPPAGNRLENVSALIRPANHFFQQSFRNRLFAFLKRICNKKNALYISCGVIVGLVAIGIIVGTGGAAAPLIVGGGVFAVLGITSGSMVAIIATGATILSLAAAVVGGVGGWLCKKVVECISCMNRSTLKSSSPVNKLPSFTSSSCGILQRLPSVTLMSIKNAAKKKEENRREEPAVNAACQINSFKCFSPPQFAYSKPAELSSVFLKRRKNF